MRGCAARGLGVRGRRDPRPGSEPRRRHCSCGHGPPFPLRRAGGGSSYPSGSGRGLHELARAARRCHVAHSTIVPSLDPVLELTWDTGAWYGGTRTRGWCTEHGLCQGSRLKSQTQRAQQGTSPRGFVRSSGPCKCRDPGPAQRPCGWLVPTRWFLLVEGTTSLYRVCTVCVLLQNMCGRVCG